MIIKKTRNFIILFLCILISTNLYGKIKSPDETKIMFASRSGMELTSKQAEKLETKITANPNDILLRVQLLSYYFNTLWRSKSRT